MAESAVAGTASTKSAVVRRRSVNRFADPNEETVHALQKVIASLTEMVEKGEEERNTLLLSIQAMGAALRDAADIQRSAAVAAAAANTRSRSRGARGVERLGVDGNLTLSAPSSRPVSPPTRSISPSAAAAFRKPTHADLDPSDSGPHDMNGSDWKLFYHRTFDAETTDARSFRNLLADHRAALSQMEVLKRSSRKAAQEYEQRIRLMQRKLTEASEQAATFRDRCLLLEAEVSSLKREANGLGGLPLSHSQHTSVADGWAFSRSVSFKSRAD